MTPQTLDETDGWTVQIAGRTPITLSLDGGAGEWPTVRRSLEYECASGDWVAGEWVGIPVIELLIAADVPDETTHIQLESAGGYLACVDLLVLEDAIIALVGEETRLDSPVEADTNGLDADSPPADGGEFAETQFPRFLAPRLLGPRTMKNLTAIRPLVLDPEEQPESYEELPIDE